MIKSERAGTRQMLAEAVSMQDVQSLTAHSARLERKIPPPRFGAATKCQACGARHAGLCGAIAEHDLDRLSEAAVIITKLPGCRFIDEGERAEHFFTISRGTAKIFKSLQDGREQVISFASRGDFLGLASSAKYAYGAEAIDDVAFCRFSRAGLRKLLADFPAMEKRLLEITRHELVLAQEQMLLLGRKSARERVASFLILRMRTLTDDATEARQAIRVSLPMSRGDIADYLGLRIETVSRTLTQMKADGLIRPDATAFGIVITNFPALSACATGE